MGERLPPPDRPDTLGRAWRRMADPRRSEPRDLPTLPDWPPLRDDPSHAAWPSLDPAVPDESHPADTLQPTETDDRLWPGQTPPAVAPTPQGRGGLLHRFRGASKRARLGIAAALVLLVVLIIAVASVALRAVGGLGTSSTLGGAVATQAAGGHGTPRVLPTVTPHLTSTPLPTAAPSTQLTLAFTCASGSIHGSGQVCVHTLPRASLSLSVRYCDGSTAKGLHGSATADGSGDYTWSWPVRTTCAGAATATVTANWNGQSLTQADTFTITK